MASAAQRAAERLGDLTLPGLAYVNARAGRKDAALQAIARMKTVSDKVHFSPLYWALVYAGVGETEVAAKWLEQSQVERNPWLVVLNSDPRFDRLRAESQFQTMLQRIG